MFFKSSEKSETKRIGSAETGYVDVPYDFVVFNNDIKLSDGTIQYSDEKGENIITLQYFDSSVADAKAYASNMYIQFANDALVKKDSIKCAMEVIDNCEAYQVYCYYPNDDTYVVTWTFNSKYDKNVHYVAVEFKTKNIKLFELVEKTYHMKG